MSLALILFWLSIFLLFYTYVLFTMLLVIRSLLRPIPYKKEPITPPVSLIIAAYNEAEGIEKKLKNILTMDYPAGQFEAIIASDGSDDGTNEIVARYAAEHDIIKLLELPRQGKAGALNDAIATASGEILVFSDANSQYATDAIRVIVQPFADATIGGVAGNQRYIKGDTPADNVGETGYWSFDRILKTLESQGGNVISATGAIYAIRRSLFQGVPEGVTDDFVTSTRVIAQGYRLVFEPDAVAFEPTAQSQTKEFGRKVRIMTRGLTAVVEMRELLNPFRHKFYALQLFTHKVLRRLMYIPLIVILIANPFLWNTHVFYQLTMLAQIGFYGLAILGWLAGKMGIKLPKVLNIPAYFCMVYLAALLASWNVVRGHRINRWSTARQS
ncbi:MAG: glycosyltransferase family 2 protein [Anaerolineae bacterium]|nr:glycosyltransferase family 2 protein [Anaerolineae bacterium]